MTRSSNARQRVSEDHMIVFAIVLDDEWPNREQNERALRSLGYRREPFVDGAEMWVQRATIYLMPMLLRDLLQAGVTEFKTLIDMSDLTATDIARCDWALQHGVGNFVPGLPDPRCN